MAIMGNARVIIIMGDRVEARRSSDKPPPFVSVQLMISKSLSTLVPYQQEDDKPSTPARRAYCGQPDLTGAPPGGSEKKGPVGGHSEPTCATIR
jgi:hypothetical protein